MSPSCYPVAQLTAVDVFLVSDCTPPKSAQADVLLVTSHLAAEVHDEALSIRKGMLYFTT